MDKRHCAIIDAKASNSYALSSDDHAKMISNYIPNYHELCNGLPLELEFCSYVAGGFMNIGSKLSQIENETKVPASAITAKDLLRLAKIIFSESQPSLRSYFCNSKLLYAKDFRS
ncbi:MAG: hypothetical protein JXB29_02880 [Sedimentisphaerales bacterium]|nr:hypothetical protein [Sedimentisphaerales bacterium]